jgi:hypothetical protein
MDQKEYQKEIDKLSNDLQIIKKDDNPTVADSKSVSKFSAYKPYIYITVLLFIFLFIIKPKFILKIKTTSETDKSIIVIDNTKFFKWWVISTTVSSLMYYVYFKYRKTI